MNKKTTDFVEAINENRYDLKIRWNLRIPDGHRNSDLVHEFYYNRNFTVITLICTEKIGKRGNYFSFYTISTLYKI